PDLVIMLLREIALVEQEGAVRGRDVVEAEIRPLLPLHRLAGHEPDRKGAAADSRGAGGEDPAGIGPHDPALLPTLLGRRCGGEGEKGKKQRHRHTWSQGSRRQSSFSITSPNSSSSLG